MSAAVHPAKRRVRKGLSALFRREDGSVTVEFVIIFPLMFSIFLASIDAGFTMVRQAMLDRAVDLAIRQVRLGQIRNDGSQRLSELICANSILLPNCVNNIAVEMQRLQPGQTTGLDAPFRCVRAEEPVRPALNFTTGAQNDLMVVRVCVSSNPLIRLTGFLSAMPINEQGTYQLTAGAIFVNEPRNS